METQLKLPTVKAESEPGEADWYLDRIKFYKKGYLEEREKNKKYEKMVKKLKTQLEQVSMKGVESTLKTILENTALIKEDVGKVRF